MENITEKEKMEKKTRKNESKIKYRRKRSRGFERNKGREEIEATGTKNIREKAKGGRIDHKGRGKKEASRYGVGKETK